MPDFKPSTLKIQPNLIYGISHKQLIFKVPDEARSSTVEKMVSTRQMSSVGGGNAGGDGVGDTGTARRNQTQVQSGPSVVVPVAESVPTRNINLLDLPIEILEKILGYMDFNSIAHLRPVSISAYL